MFGWLGRVITRHPWRALAVWLIVLLAAGGGAFWGYGQGGLFDRLDNSVSLVPGTESDTVNKLTSGAGGVGLTIVVGGLELPGQAQQVAAFMSVHRTDLTIDNVDTVLDPFALPDPTLPQAQALFSDKQDGFVIIVTLKPGLTTDEQKTTEAALTDAINKFQTDLQDVVPAATAGLVSTRALSGAIMDQVRVDLIRGETVGVPVALILLIIVFGGVLAAGLPIVGALVAIGIGMGALWAMTFASTVEAFTLNIASIIGLALSVDYGLLIVSRYREELAATLTTYGYPPGGTRVPRKYAARTIVRESMQTTVRTAGRTVFFSALTIAVALTALLTMKAPMMRIIAISGIVVTLLAVLTAITLVPAIIVLMNRTLVKPSVITRIPGLRSVVKAVGDSSSDTGFFSTLARGVHRHPWIIMLLMLVILVIMASPLRELQMRTAFTDYMPPGAAATKAYFTIQDDYPALVSASIVVVADRPPGEVGALYDHLKTLPDTAYVAAPKALASDPNRSQISVRIDLENQVGSEITTMVTDLRAYDAGYPIHVGGPAALQYDFVQSIVDRGAIALTIMVLAVFILMFLMTGSVIVPLKAIIINSLSLLASLGATTFIFMNGYLGMPKVPGMETFILVCAVCFGFGLAMDYEVFLIARVKEFWDKGYANDEAVERGLQRSGRIITSAAAIIIAVFIGFTFGDMVPIKEIGVALAITVATDATLVRLLLVPSTMTILGKWNWWAPKPLRWVYGKLHLTH